MDYSSAEPACMGPQADVGASNHLTRTNMIAILLALQICQLTQPRGSLLFRQAGGFLWRCNPIASFMEACCIFFSLATGAFLAILGGVPLRLVQNTAGAMLLLRAADAEAFNHAYTVLAQRLELGCEKSQQSGQPGAEEVKIPPGADEDVFESLAANEAAAYSALKFGPMSTPEQMQKDHGILPQVTTALNAILGTKAFSRQSLYIYLCATAVEIYILVKLFSVQGNFVFRSLALMLIIGWSSVQLLIVLYSFPSAPTFDDLAVLRSAFTYNVWLQLLAFVWDWASYGLHLPLLAYTSYRLSWSPWIAADATGFSGYLAYVSVWCSTFLVYFLQAFTLRVAYGIYNTWRQIPGTSTRGNTITYSLLLLLFWLNVSMYSYVHQIGGPIKLKSGQEILYPGVFKDGTLLHALFDNGYSFLVKTFWLFILFVWQAFGVLLVSCQFGPQMGLLTHTLPKECERYWNHRSMTAANAAAVFCFFAIYVARCS